MKKVMNKINFALIALMASVPAFAAKTTSEYNAGGDMCKMIESLQGVFKTLRTLAFIGAAFYIAGWAWEYIKGGEAKMDDIKKKGIGLLVGFALLMMVGVLLSFITTASGLKVVGCDAFTGGW